jgi:5-methylthioribose kinase
MLPITVDNAHVYLRNVGLIDLAEPVEITVLEGGVSNHVLYVARPTQPGHDFVLKQARPQLRTADLWFADVERIWREIDVLRWCERILARHESPEGHAITTPGVLFEDRPQYVFAMQAAPRGHLSWRAELLDGKADPSIAAACGRLLGWLHADTWDHAGVASDLADRRLFDQLRLDPYYRAAARANPEHAGLFNDLIDSIGPSARALTHADFSPKNLLVYPGGLMMVDFETGHFGDPAFDLGFFLTHLVLKAFHFAGRHETVVALMDAFWREYRRVVSAALDASQLEPLVACGIRHLGGCLWARIDGKSKIDYLAADRRPLVRELARTLLSDSPAEWDAAAHTINRFLADCPPAT